MKAIIFLVQISVKPAPGMFPSRLAAASLLTILTAHHITKLVAAAGWG
jgi:hypothetical protein